MTSVFTPSTLKPKTEHLISSLVNGLRTRGSLIRVDKKFYNGVFVFKIRNASNKRVIYITQDGIRGIKVNLTQANPAHADFIAEPRRVDVRMQYVDIDAVDIDKLREYLGEDVGEVLNGLMIPTVNNRKDLKTEDQVFASFARPKPKAPYVFKDGKQLMTIVLFPSMEEVIIDMNYLGARVNYLKEGAVYVENAAGSYSLYRVNQFNKIFKSNGIEIPNLH